MPFNNCRTFLNTARLNLSPYKAYQSPHNTNRSLCKPNSDHCKPYKFLYVTGEAGRRNQSRFVSFKPHLNYAPLLRALSPYIPRSSFKENPASSDYSGPPSGGQFRSEWIVSNNINQKYKAVQPLRVPPSNSIYADVALTAPVVRQLIRFITREITGLKFSVQYHAADGRKPFIQASPEWSTGEELLGPKDYILDDIINNPNNILTLKHPTGSQLVVVDLDPPTKDDTSSPFELPILKGLPELLQVDEQYRPNAGPLVIQSPRGLHLIFKVPPTMSPKPQPNRSQLCRLGFHMEYISFGHCALIGQNYRLLTDINKIAQLSSIPYGLWPIHSSVNKPLTIDGLVRSGNRYNTVLRGIETGQLAYLGGSPLVRWFLKYLCEPNPAMQEAEVNHLCQLAQRKWISSPKGKKAGTLPNPEVFPADARALVPVAPATAIAQGTLRDLVLLGMRGVATGRPYGPGEERDAVQNLIRSPVFQLVQQDLPYMATLYLMVCVYGHQLGNSMALAAYMGGVKRFLIYNKEDEEWLFYSISDGVWVAFPEDALRNTVRALVYNFGPPEIQGRVALDGIIAELKDRLSVPNWGLELTGFVYPQGVLLLGWKGAKLLDPHPEYQLRTRINTSFDESLEFKPETQAYLQNLSYYNPTNLALLRGELFKSLFNLLDPSHFLYISGPPSTGKSLLFKVMESIMGKESVYRAPAVNIDSPFTFAGVSSNLKYLIYEDLDASGHTHRVLSFIKEQSTRTTLKVKRKFQNKESSFSNVHYALITNSFIPATDTGEALERRQVILEPRAIPLSAVRTDLFDVIRSNTAALIQWIRYTPHILLSLFKYSAPLNYMATSGDYSWNSGVEFVMTNLDKFFVTGDAKWSYPLSTLTITDGGTYGPLSGLYVAYQDSQVRKHADNNTILDQRSFTGILNNLSASVFHLQPHEKTGSHVSTVRIPGTQGTDRICWHGVWFYPDPSGKSDEIKARGWRPLEPRIPLNVAVLALLHPATCDAPFQGEAYTPGISVHEKYPLEWLEHLYTVVQKGPDPELKKVVIAYEQKVLDCVERINKRELEYERACANAARNIFNPSPDYSTGAIDVTTQGGGENAEPVQGVGQEAITIRQPLTDTILDGINFDQGPFSLRGVPDPGAAGREIRISGATNQADIYNMMQMSMEALKKGETFGEGPHLESEVSVDEAQAKYICKSAFIKLSDAWVRGKPLNAAAFYHITINSSWDEVLAANNAISLEAPTLVWDASHTTIMDVRWGPSPPVTHPEGPLPPGQPPHDNSEVSYVSDSSPMKAEPLSEYVGGAPSSDQELVNNIIEEKPAPTYEEPVENVTVTSIVESTTIDKPRKGGEDTQLKRRNKVVKASEAAAKLAQITNPEYEWSDNIIQLVPKIAAILVEGPDPLELTNAPGLARFLGPLFASLNPEEQAFVADVDLFFKKECLGKGLDYSAVLLKVMYCFKYFKNAVNQEQLLSNKGNLYLDPNTTFFEAFKNADWGIDNLSPNSWKQPFPNAATVEHLRDMFAGWPNICKTPNILNDVLGSSVAKGGLAYAYVSNIHDLVTGRINYSPATGGRNRTFFWSKKTLEAPFATAYIGNSAMADPGRLAVQGSNFTTYRRSFRDIFIPLIFGVVEKICCCTFFILDLKGAHAAFQAALLKETTPILFGIYSSGGRDIWSTFVELSSEHYPIFITDKPLLKTTFYAALNGGFIGSESAILKHLTKTQREGDPLFTRLGPFARAFLQHPICKELAKVREFWASLNGTMYVPTRSTPLVRRVDTAMAERKYNEWARIQASSPTPQTVPPSYLQREGDPLSKNLPSLYYTSLEIIFMMQLVTWVVEWSKDHNRVGLVQGIHDGFLFVVEGTPDLTALERFVNQKLKIATKASLGLTLEAQLTHCSSPEWLATSEEE